VRVVAFDRLANYRFGFTNVVRIFRSVALFTSGFILGKSTVYPDIVDRQADE
jgi:hypothetical protein